MCTVSGKRGNITSSVRRMCSDTRGTHPSRGGVRKNKRGGGGMVEGRGKEEEKKNNRSVEWNIKMHKGYIIIYL